MKPASGFKEGGASQVLGPWGFLKNVLFRLSLSLLLEAANSCSPPPSDFTNTQTQKASKHSDKKMAEME